MKVLVPILFMIIMTSCNVNSDIEEYSFQNNSNSDISFTFNFKPYTLDKRKYISDDKFDNDAITIKAPIGASVESYSPEDEVTLDVSLDGKTIKFENK